MSAPASLLETLLLAGCAAVAAAGYGAGASRILQLEVNAGDRGILGLLILSVLGCLFHFFTPLDTGAQGVILAGGVLLALISLRRKPDVPVLLIFVFALSHRQANVVFDTGLYHLQTLRWIHEHPIVAGLSNLHGRFGYNSNLFPLAAVVDWQGAGWVANCLLMAFVLVSLFSRLRRGHAHPVEYWMLMLSMFVLGLNRYFSVWYGVLNADVFSAVLILYWCCVALRVSGAGAERGVEIAMAVTAALLAVTVKVAAAPVLLPTAGLAWMYRRNLPGALIRRLALCAVLVLGTWMLRGVVLSGCAVYPAVQTCIASLPWSEPVSEVKDMALAIQSWARQPGEFDFAKVLSDNSWVFPWLRAVRQDHSIQWMLFLVPLGLLSALPRRRFEAGEGRSLVVIAAGLAGGVIFWFSTAPDPRFGRGFILAAALLGASLTASAIAGYPRFAKYVPALILAGMTMVSIRGLGRVSADFLYAPPSAATYQVKGPGGRRIFVPKSREQCWDHPLPCTPYFNESALSRVRWPDPPSPGAWTPGDLSTAVIQQHIYERSAERRRQIHPREE